MINNLQNRNRGLVVGGIYSIWYIPMDKLTVMPFLSNVSIITRDVATVMALKEIDTESGSLELYVESSLDGAGIKHDLQLVGENLILSPEKDNEINLMMRKKHLVFFRDNHNQWRFIMNARLVDKHGTGLFRDGKPSYNILFTAQNVVSAYYYSGTVTINADRSITLS
jgi:hypothetical protein